MALNLVSRSVAVSVSIPVVISLLALGLGCSKQETATRLASSNAGQPTAIVLDAAGAEAVVGEFLDRIRRGGADHNTMTLLTQKAQSELARIGQEVQPIGSPDAQFQVTRSTPIPQTDQTSGNEGRLVHCLWREPAQLDAQGNTVVPASEYQVVWSVQPEAGQWKISGLVLEMAAGQPPILLDFENGDLMAKILSPEPAVETAAETNQNPGTIQR